MVSPNLHGLPLGSQVSSQKTHCLRLIAPNICVDSGSTLTHTKIKWNEQMNDNIDV